MWIACDHNTRSKKQLLFEDALKKMEGNIIEQIWNLNDEVKFRKDEFLNMKDVIKYEGYNYKTFTRRKWITTFKM